MILRVLGSSSSGNGYLLQSEKTGEVLILEAGIRLDKLKKELSFDLTHVAGCIVTHEHGDHARYAHDYANAYIPVYMSHGTAQARGISNMASVKTIKPFKPFSVGSFMVMAFPVQHDAKEPFGFLIKHTECGNVLFATDTYYLRYTFPGLHQILIECNYSPDILQKNVQLGRIDHKRYERTVRSHMSYDTCLETLNANDLSRVNNIILIHLSDDNSQAEKFANGIAAATQKNVMVARKGMVVRFNKTPY